MWFFRVLLLGGLKKIYLHKSSFWWIVTQKLAFPEWGKSVKGSNSHLWPHFPENVKPLFLSKLQLSAKEHLSGPKSWWNNWNSTSPSTYNRVSLNCMMFTAMKFFQTGVMMSSQPPSLCALLLLFFFSLMIVFSPNNCLFGTIDSVSHCHGFAGK